MEDKTAILEIYNLSSQQDFDLYNSYLKKIDDSNPFYKLELLKVNSNNNQQLLYFVYGIENGPLILMPFYLREIVIEGKKTNYFDVISPYGYSGPLFDQKISENELSAFWLEVDTWYKDNQVVSEFIRFSLTNNHDLYSGTLIHTLKNVRGIILEEDVQWNNFKHSVRKNYRNALKNDLQFKMYHKNIDSTKIEEFYSIYIGTMKRNAADESFYHTIEYFTNFISKNPERCSIATIYKDNIAISTELLLLSKDTMYSYLGGTNSNYFNLRPNDLLKIEALSWGRNQGLKYYLLGGGLADEDGLYQYKKKFFPDDPDSIFYSGRKIVDKNTYQTLVNRKNSINVNPDFNEDNIEVGYFPKYRSIN